MRRAAYYSAGLHLGIVFFAAVIWPLLDFNREMPEPIMPVEIVASLPQSKSEPKPDPKPDPAPEPPKEAKPEPPTPTPPTPPPPQPPAPKVEQQPDAVPLQKLAFEVAVRNTNRTVGTMLGHAVTTQYAGAGLPNDTIVVRLRGSHSLTSDLPVLRAAVRGWLRAVVPAP